MRMAVRSKEKLAAVRASLGEAAGAAGPLRLSLGHTTRRAALLEHRARRALLCTSVCMHVTRARTAHEGPRGREDAAARTRAGEEG